MSGPQSLIFSFNPETGNVVFTMEGLSLEVDLDAQVSAAWFLPVTIQTVFVDNMNFQMQASGRKHDPNCWAPISSKTTIDDFDVIIKQGIEQRIADRFHGTILDTVNSVADMMVPTLVGSIIELVETDF